MLEVEQKFRIHDAESLERRLHELGAREVADTPTRSVSEDTPTRSASEGSDQLDHYFNHPSRDFAQTDEALRLRHVGWVKSAHSHHPSVENDKSAETHLSQNFITYKGPKLDATTKTRREIELPLPPGSDTLAHFTELLTALGFRPVAQVRKTR